MIRRVEMSNEMKSPLECLIAKKEEEYESPLKVLIELNREKKQRESREKLIKHLKPIREGQE